MALSPDDRRVLVQRVPAAAVDAVDAALEPGEELREALVDVHGEVVAFTARRALFVKPDAADVRAFGYADIDVRQRAEGLGVDAAVEGDRLVLAVARGTFVRLGGVGQGSPPSRATWLPVLEPSGRPSSEPSVPPPAATSDTAEPGIPPPGAEAAAEPGAEPDPGASAGEEAAADPAGVDDPAVHPGLLPPPGWHPDPSGRHWWRWWDGRGWTEHVADGGSSFVDPLPRR